jgi:hypothetical protein
MYRPISINLDSLTHEPEGRLLLLRVTDAGGMPVACQVQAGKPRRLYWIVPDGESAVYELKKTVPPTYGPGPVVHVRDDDSTFTIIGEGKLLLCYHYATAYPPPGVDSAFRRSGFIHPLWTPHGQVLTRIQAPDHYHHYGLWNPWTHVLFEGDTVDFWNLGDKKGFVRFAKLLGKEDGPIYAQIKVLHEHVVTKHQQVALREVQTIRVYRQATDEGYYYLDITSELRCATDSPVRLLTYRYGGLGWRATPEWNKDNSEVLTSEGRDRKGADGSTARWCIVQGALGKDYGGVVLLSHPTNYNHPEPLRVWPDNSNGKGDLFVNFSPTKNRDWLLQPGKTYILRYRLVVFNGKFDKDKAEAAWKDFVNKRPPALTPQQPPRAAPR